jgi:hypothetical protein
MSKSTIDKLIEHVIEAEGQRIYGSCQRFGEFFDC